MVFIALVIATGFLAGIYPAFYLSSFNPVKVLKGKMANSLAAAFIRKGLVVFQFIISIVLIIAAVVITRQMNYIRTADLGFDRDQQIIIPLRTSAAKSLYASLKPELGNQSGVLSVGASKYYPGSFNPSENGFYKDGQTQNDTKPTWTNWIDADFLKTLKIQLVAGRGFSDQLKSDTGSGIILNETATRAIGFRSAKDAIGNKIYSEWKGKISSLEVVGVVKDFHYQDLHLPVTPYGFQMLTDNSGGFDYAIVHTKKGQIGRVLHSVQNFWRKYNPNEPFEFSFLDEEF